MDIMHVVKLHSKFNQYVKSVLQYQMNAMMSSEMTDKFSWHSEC